MNNLIPLEFKNKRIMTTSVIAESYEVVERKITDNFNNNKERYQQGKHYYLLQGEELKQFKGDNENFGFATNINKLYLWTEKGALLHAKSLNTDKAWEVYDQLVETYFRTKENKPTCIEDILISSLQEMKALKGEVQAVKQANAENQEAIQGIRDVVALNSIDWKSDSKSLIVNIASKLGGNQFIQDVYREAYSLLERRAGCQLKIRKTNKQKKMALEGVCKSKINAVSNLDVIGEDKRLLECFLAIVKEMAIKYDADR